MTTSSQAQQAHRLDDQTPHQRPGLAAIVSAATGDVLVLARLVLLVVIKGDRQSLRQLRLRPVLVPRCVV